MKRYTLLRTFMLFIAALILCGWSSAHTQISITKGLKAPEQTVCFEPDTTSVLKNPLTGWVMYLGRAWDENFWQTQFGCHGRTFNRKIQIQNAFRWCGRIPRRKGIN